jgi:hypothetical protein
MQPNSKKSESYLDKKQIVALEQVAGVSLRGNGC